MDAASSGVQLCTGPARRKFAHTRWNRYLYSPRAINRLKFTMRKASAKETLKNFFQWMTTYRGTLTHVIAIDTKLPSREEKIEIFEAFVPKIYAQWTILAEDLLIDCLNRDSSQYATYFGHRLPKHMARPQCEIMLTGTGYFDFKSTGNLIGLAKQILVSANNPFPGIKDSARRKIDGLTNMRNYLAHYSRVSQRSLKKYCASAYGLRTFREPGDFLIAKQKPSGDPSLFGFIDALEQAAAEMADFLHVDL
jgi:hypothetical protein